MQGSIDFEKVLFLHIYNNPKYYKNLKPNSLFDTLEIQTLGTICKAFYERFKEIPSTDQLKLLIKDNKFSDKINDERLDLIFNHNIKQYDDDWLNVTTEHWILWKSFNESIISGMDYIKKTKVTPDNVQHVVNKVKNIIVDGSSIRFDDTLGLDFFDPASHEQLVGNKITSNFRWIDRNTSGGYDTKTLISYIGQPNIGKSIWLANDAVNFIQGGTDVAVISCEMSDRKIIKRIGANMMNIKMSEYDKVSRDQEYIRKKLSAVKNGMIKPGNLYVKEYPTDQVTVLDIEAYLRELEQTKGIKLKVVIIDYINILCNYRNPNSENTYMKVKQISQDLRAMAQKNNWLVITATQVTTDSYDSTDLSLKNISESRGLAHTCDLIYGIIQDPTMNINNEYWLKLLKVRDGAGKNTKCKFNIDYEYMRLSETDIVENDILIAPK